ncbi:MAG: hypothetical protein WC119_00300 [Synergistaceae bacterium]
MIDKELEYLSNKVRKGIPIGIPDILRVIKYQKRKKSIKDRIISNWYYMKGLTGEENEE